MNAKTLIPLNSSEYKHVLCCCWLHRVQFVPLSPRSHLRTAFMRAPGVGSSSTAAIILQTEGGRGKREYRDKTQTESSWGGERKRNVNRIGKKQDVKVRRREDRKEMWNVKKEGQRGKRARHWGRCERNAAAASNMYKKQRGQLPEVSST